MAIIRLPLHPGRVAGSPQQAAFAPGEPPCPPGRPPLRHDRHRRITRVLFLALRTDEAGRGRSSATKGSKGPCGALRVGSPPLRACAVSAATTGPLAELQALTCCAPRKSWMIWAKGARWRAPSLLAGRLVVCRCKQKRGRGSAATHLQPAAEGGRPSAAALQCARPQLHGAEPRPTLNPSQPPAYPLSRPPGSAAGLPTCLRPEAPSPSSRLHMRTRHG